MATAVRSTALRAGGACVRCRKGKTKCVYENGRAPCKNCAKGFHECYLPSESMSHGGHGVSPARVQQRVRESLPSDRAVSSTAMDRQAPPASGVSRHVSVTTEKYVFAYLFIFHRFLLFSGPFFFFWPSPNGSVASYSDTPKNGPIFPARPPFPQNGQPAFSCFRSVAPRSWPHFRPTPPRHPMAQSSHHHCRQVRLGGP